MTEQVLNIDPKTGKRLPGPPSADSRQNDGYQPTNDAHLGSRDFSRPHTIPKDEFEAATGRSHEEACRVFVENEREREDGEPNAEEEKPE